MCTNVSLRSGSVIGVRSTCPIRWPFRHPGLRMVPARRDGPVGQEKCRGHNPGPRSMKPPGCEWERACLCIGRVSIAPRAPGQLKPSRSGVTRHREHHSTGGRGHDEAIHTPGRPEAFGRGRGARRRPDHVPPARGGRRGPQGRRRLRLADRGDRLDQAAQPGRRGHRRRVRRPGRRDRARQRLRPTIRRTGVRRAGRHRQPAYLRDQFLARHPRC